MNYDQNFKKHSKTFSFAASFFGTKMSSETAKLYYFFRCVDDLVDENKDLDDEQKIEKIKEITHYKEINELKKKYQIPEDVLEVFIEFAKKDITFQKIQNKEDLLKYCYGVASTVGICMCHIFGVKSKEALYHAIDLGMAMQLTNICRDVYEDYQNDRLYLPELSVNDFELEKCKEIESIQIKYLKLANQYYESGFQGLKYLPLRVSFVVFLAGKLYQKIGEIIIQKKNYKIRAYVPTFKKLYLAFVYLFEFLIFTIRLYLKNNTIQRPYKKERGHNNNLHKEITNLPYVHQ